ncbi:MAG: flagellar hook-basal body complex protein FliE [Deltaproteobacteria bacterium]|nr:flagellar hook-basal body complex protein FliE [Deltaproteobacteria bacterium]
MDHSQQIESPVAPELSGVSGLDGGAGPKSFGEMLSQSLDKVNELQMQADTAAKELTAGRNKNIHETMLMMEKADMSFRLMMQVRNKVIDAYREVMRMQV